MSLQRIVGVALVITGISLLIVGLNASHSMADRVHDTFTGRFTDGTTWYIVGGIGVGILGLFMGLFGFGGRSASTLSAKEH